MKIDELCIYLGMVHGALNDPDMAAAFVAILKSNKPGQERVWLYTQMLRDKLTELLVKAGREGEP